VTQYTIQPVSTGEFLEAEASLLYNLADQENFGRKIPATYWMFVVRGPDTVIIVDDGPGDPETWGRDYHHWYNRSADQEPITALRRIGIAPEDVDIVVNTHLHWDHCHHNHLFPNAVIRVQATEIIEALNPIPVHKILYTPPEANPPWTQVIHKTIPVHGDEVIAPGITALAMPSHTIGFQSVLVETAHGPILIAGDMLPYFDNWTGRWGYKRIPSGILQASLHDYFKCFERVEQIDPAVILPGVDPRVAEKEIYG
jgi:glyoxylase-like metal-dependent hydrolase (beta-lactamase superfamily II)